MPYIGAGTQRFNTADGLTVSGNASVSGTTALTGNATAAGNLDVTGNVDVDGTTTVDGLTSSAALDVTTSTHANASVFKSTGNTQIMLQDTDASSNDQFWGFQVSGGDFNILTCDDDRSGGFVTPLTIAQAGNTTLTCTAGDSNQALQAYHPTSTSARNIAKFQSNVGSTQADVVTIGCDGGIEAVGEITTTNSLSQSSNSIRTVIGNDGGSATFGTSTNHQIKLFTNNTQRGVLDSDGKLLIGATSYSNTSNVSGAQLAPDSPNVLGVNADLVLLLNRRTNDGNLISFQQDKSEEGSISVSGTTVSYNGGHLSRWSQATDGNRIDGLVKGTVMTNLDQMAKWHHEAQAAKLYEDGDEIPEGKKVGDEKTPAVDAYTEDNEQLNCMAVSSVEGDVNVAGVFVNWDDDDKYFTADMNVAMTGDMVIRIAKDTTVARGDLLMSAGDGTAKPQDDDIVRSKTIAKVTSTVKSHTYDDGTYLVPCVLMAC